MCQKILIVGGVVGGASVATRLRRNCEEDSIIMFEKGPNVLFSNCALPYHLSEIIKDSEKLISMTPEAFLKNYNIEARVNAEVIAIDRFNKKLRVRDSITGNEYSEEYDKLVLAPGAEPIVPDIPGLEKTNAFMQGQHGTDFAGHGPPPLALRAHGAAPAPADLPWLPGNRTAAGFSP